MNNQTRSIALVEDEFTLKTGLNGKLEKEGFKMESLKLSPDIIKKLVALNPSIIIMDLDESQPDDPFRIIAAIKKEEKLKEAELFVYTVKIDVKTEVGLRKLKIVSYFTKSEDPLYLIEGIRNHFSWDEMSREYDPFEEYDLKEENKEPVERAGNEKAGLHDVAEATQPADYVDSEEFKEMLDEFHEGIDQKLEGSDQGPEAYYNLGISYFEMELLDQALGQLEKSSKDPDWKLKSMTMIGAVHRRKGDFDKAAHTFKVCYQLAGDSFAKLGFRYEIADTLAAQGKLVDAYKMFATVYKADKSFKDTRNRLLEIKASLESENKL